MRADIIRHLPLFPYILGTGFGTLPPMDISAGSHHTPAVKIRIIDSSVCHSGNHIIVLVPDQAPQDRVSFPQLPLYRIPQTAPAHISSVIP